MLNKESKRRVRRGQLGTEKEVRFALGLVMAQCHFHGGDASAELTQCRHDLGVLCGGADVAMSGGQIDRCRAYVTAGRVRLDDGGRDSRSLRQRLEESGGDYLIEGAQVGGRMLVGSPDVDGVAVDAAVEAALDQAEAFNVVH